MTRPRKNRPCHPPTPSPLPRLPSRRKTNPCSATRPASRTPSPISDPRSSKPPTLNPRSNQLLDSWIGQDSEDSPFWRIHADTLADVDHTHLTAAARTLHDRALDQHAGSTEALADIAATIERLPPNTAAAIYFGLLSSMFLEQPHNEPRIPPKSSIAEQLLAFAAPTSPAMQSPSSAGTYIVPRNVRCTSPPATLAAYRSRSTPTTTVPRPDNLPVCACIPKKICQPSRSSCSFLRRPNRSFISRLYSAPALTSTPRLDRPSCHDLYLSDRFH